MQVTELAAFYKNKNILITGGLGFIGSAIARRMVEYGADVTIVDSMIPQYGGNLFNINGIEDDVTVNFSDVRDPYSLNFLVQGKDILFNMAGTLSHVDSMKDPHTDLEINCRSQLSILESCREYNPDIKVMYAGSRSQYGRPQYIPVDEKHPLIPTDVNGINIIAGERYHLLYNDVYNIRSCSIRLVNVFGPGHQMKHHRQGVLNWFIRQLLEGNPIKLYGGGEQLRDCVYVDDAVDVFVLAAAREEADGEIFNVGAHPVSLKQFAEVAVKEYGSGEVEVVEFPDHVKQIEIGDYVADYSKIKKVLGWEPQVSLEEGIRHTINYYNAHQDEYWTKGEVL